jgi:hypothetical protein
MSQDAQIAGVWNPSNASSTASLSYWFNVNGKIPPLVHQIWDDPTVENSCQISAQSWEWFCSVYGCRHKLWRRADLETLTPFVNRQHYLDMQSPQMRADIARYEILNKHGGLYLDCDMIWVRIMPWARACTRHRAPSTRSPPLPPPHSSLLHFRRLLVSRCTSNSSDTPPLILPDCTLSLSQTSGLGHGKRVLASIAESLHTLALSSDSFHLLCQHTAVTRPLYTSLLFSPNT